LLDSLDAWAGDQAAGLRRLFGGRAPRVVAFASGRDACGRTTLLVQTSAALAAAGHGVVIIDENLAADNTLAAFGVTARHDLLHAIRGDCTLPQVAVTAAPLIRIVLAARAARELDQRELDHRGRGNAVGRLADCLRELQRGAGFVLIDTAARRGGHLSPLALAAPHVAVVVAAHGAAITHAYALIKRLAQEYGRDGFQIVITRARSREEAQAIFDNMRRVARAHLDVRLEFLGDARVPVNDDIAEALLARLPEPADDGDGNGFLFPSAATTPAWAKPATLDSVV
jgi:flagellar biosynthesis protein FlhG